MEKTICELFAGVGGFRLGFDALASGWDTVWFSQWEPGKKIQWAHDCYVSHFGDSPDTNGEYHTGEDIAEVDKTTIPDHTLLVGGFPCQDYSVAHSLSSSQGIEGRKGVLWWQIRDTIIAKHPPFCLFENVDRLLKSPAKQRGRDFGMILACLANLGYSAEWRVINAAEYGGAQRRRRIFIFAYKDTTQYAQSIAEETAGSVILEKGLMPQAFPVSDIASLTEAELPEDLYTVSDTFSFPFKKAGYMTGGKIYTTEVTEKGEPPIVLGKILEPCPEENEDLYLDVERLKKWTYLKGAKKIPRIAANGHKYVFSEGPVAFPDTWDKPARTMLTSESTLNRSTHVVNDPHTGKLRLLLPEEAEKLQGFPSGWTGITTANGKKMPRRMRYFCMGNALVVPMITRMGRVLDAIIEKEP